MQHDHTNLMHQTRRKDPLVYKGLRLKNLYRHFEILTGILVVPVFMVLMFQSKSSHVKVSTFE